MAETATTAASLGKKSASTCPGALSNRGLAPLQQSAYHLLLPTILLVVGAAYKTNRC